MKRRRNNSLLALQGRISAEVHREWEGREVEVFVERMSRASISDQPSDARSSSSVELRWERAGAALVPHSIPKLVQMSGRTPGDLIAVFDWPESRDPQGLIGRVVAVRVTGSRPLLLRCEVIHK